jgi:hypothetical protein
MSGPSSGVADGELLVQARQFGQVLELPMTVYFRWSRIAPCTAYRPVLPASWNICFGRPWKRDMSSFVLLSHNFELLTPSKRRVDQMMIRRLERLCTFLDRHRDVFRVRGMRGTLPATRLRAYSPLCSSLWRTSGRLVEQAWRRVAE